MGHCGHCAERVTMNPVLVEVWRGNAIESEHAGALAVLDADGGVLLALGDIDRPVFPRSAVKALQALPLVESDAADRLALNDDELAIACASHNGEPDHVRTAAGMLAKAGVDEGVLECGTHWPYADAAVRELASSGRSPTALNNNCSGKHAGFVCLACALMGWNDSGLDLRQFVKGYVKPEHPVMREVADALQSTTGFDLDKAPRGTDGCSIPTYGIPLRHLARAFARFGSGVGLREGQARAARRLRAAVAKSPFMVAGTDRFDTVVMQRFGERVFCKVGAEGMYCAALPEHGLGVAIKISDGNNARAAEVVMAAVVESLVATEGDEQAFMRRYSDFRLKNWNGIEVGALRATPDLRKALVSATAPRRA
jgi:L-asparaginase II